MRYAFADVVFQEVPDEISLLFFICGCPHRCPGCHSASLWNAEQGQLLSLDVYHEWLDRYAGLVTCILFFGGEWWPEQLVSLLKTARGRGFKTCLYTGLDRVSPEVQKHLDYLKTGPWNPRLGGLDQPGTNQRFLRLDTGEVLNSRFHR
jgi:anaerobic ribonucleoside-triphosphate reductase activating protein